MKTRYFHTHCGGEFISTGIVADDELQYQCSKCHTQGFPYIENDLDDPYFDQPTKIELEDGTASLKSMYPRHENAMTVF
jgi:hypothetical protein